MKETGVFWCVQNRRDPRDQTGWDEVQASLKARYLPNWHAQSVCERCLWYSSGLSTPEHPITRSASATSALRATQQIGRALPETFHVAILSYCILLRTTRYGRCVFHLKF